MDFQCYNVFFFLLHIQILKEDYEPSMVLNIKSGTSMNHFQCTKWFLGFVLSRKCNIIDARFVLFTFIVHLQATKLALGGKSIEGSSLSYSTWDYVDYETNNRT